MKKQDGDLTVTLERTVDILADLGRWRADRPAPVLVGFAAETSDVIGYASRKREAKRVDLIVANDVGQPGAGFEVETNIASFVTAEGVAVVSARGQDRAGRTHRRVHRRAASCTAWPAAAGRPTTAGPALRARPTPND